jgi:DNA replication protein DnaC
MERNFQNCRRYALTFSLNSGNLLFVGGTGLGKTFLSACIARAVADRGYSVMYETASHMFSKLEKAKFTPTEDSRREADKLMECDLLIIDDLGTEVVNQFTLSCLYHVINTRLNLQKPTIISTNLTPGELRKLYSDRISSRLTGEFQVIPFYGTDVRKQKLQTK